MRPPSFNPEPAEHKQRNSGSTKCTFHALKTKCQWAPKIFLKFEEKISCLKCQFFHDLAALWPAASYWPSTVDYSPLSSCWTLLAEKRTWSLLPTAVARLPTTSKRFERAASKTDFFLGGGGGILNSLLRKEIYSCQDNNLNIQFCIKTCSDENCS